jgi:hypothetical protein
MLRLARYELGTILGKISTIQAKATDTEIKALAKSNQTNPRLHGNHTNNLQQGKNIGDSNTTENNILRRRIRSQCQSETTIAYN